MPGEKANIMERREMAEIWARGCEAGTIPKTTTFEGFRAGFIAGGAHVLAEIRRQMGGTATIENPHSLAGKWLEGHDSMHLYVKGILDSLEKST